MTDYSNVINCSQTCKIFLLGGIQKVRLPWSVRGGSLKRERKRTGGESNLSVLSLCEKICLIFEKTNRVFSDK